MSREILFRGKREDNAEWVEGNLYYDPDLEHTQILGFEYENSESGLERGEVCNVVIPETVGQYTGLIDKNDKRIFEGDILKCYDAKIEIEFMAVVEFGNPNGTYSWGWQLKPISGDTFVNPDILLWLEIEETGAHSEIIGNIHDNPELLEV